MPLERVVRQSGRPVHPYCLDRVTVSPRPAHALAVTHIRDVVTRSEERREDSAWFLCRQDDQVWGFCPEDARAPERGNWRPGRDTFLFQQKQRKQGFCQVN